MGKTSLEKLELLQKEIKDRIKLVRSAQKQKSKKEESRKKILLGALLMKWMDEDVSMNKKVQRELPGFLTRDIDRSLFSLEEVQH